MADNEVKSVTLHALTTGMANPLAIPAPLPVASSDPVEQLDCALDAIHHVNRALPKTVLGRDELVAIAGLLTQVSSALLTLTDLLSAPAHHCDHTRLRRGDTKAVRPRTATSILRDCRNGYLVAHSAARTFHAHLRWCHWTTTRNGKVNRGSP